MELTGLSGCRLQLISPRIVRKWSSSTDYNPRLVKQINKQILFSNFVLKGIATPRVLNSSVDELVYFDMEYASGISSSNFFLSAGVDEVDFVVESLCGYLDNFLRGGRVLDVKIKIADKLSSLERASRFPDFIRFLLEQVAVSNQIVVPHTFCHGDLTFDNIIFHENRLYFIDFLDSYVDSVLSDLVKLKQELVHMWSLRSKKMLSARVLQAYKYIWLTLQSRYEQHMETEVFDLLDIINILRIEPYLKNGTQQDILASIVESSGLYAKFIGTNGRTSFKGAVSL